MRNLSDENIPHKFVPRLAICHKTFELRLIFENQIYFRSAASSWDILQQAVSCTTGGYLIIYIRSPELNSY